MSQAIKVAEIFSVAGQAFSKLSYLAMSLQANGTQDGGKWEDEEIEMLKKAISQFGNDIERISERIKTKSSLQIKNALKSKVTQNLTNYPINKTPTPQKAVPVTNNIDAPQITIKEQVPSTPEPIYKPTQQFLTPSPEHQQHLASSPVYHCSSEIAQAVANIPSSTNDSDQYLITNTPPGQEVTLSCEESIMTPPRHHQIPTQSPLKLSSEPIVPLKPRLITIQGQNIAEKTNIAPIASPVQISSLGTKMTIMPGATSPAAVIASQLNKSPSKVRLESPIQKLSTDQQAVPGIISSFDTQSPNKKAKVDGPNILTSALFSQKGQTILNQASVSPGNATSQGFQVIMPSSTKNMYPICVRPTGIVQRVADANSTTGNIDVEG